MRGGLERKTGGISLVQRSIDGTAPGTPGKRTLTEQLGVAPHSNAADRAPDRSASSTRKPGDDATATDRGEQERHAAVDAGGAPASEREDRAGHHGWKPPTADQVMDWLIQDAGLWTDVALQAFNDFRSAVNKDIDKDGNVGALIGIFGSATWFLGGFFEVPPVEALGVSLSILSQGIPHSPSHDGNKQDSDILYQIEQNILNFSSKINNHAGNPDRAKHIQRRTEVRDAGSYPAARSAVRKLTHLPDTSDRSTLLGHIAHGLIAEYLHKKRAYIEHDKADYGSSYHLKNVSSDVADAFADDMHMDPMPLTKDGRLARNPFHLNIKKVNVNPFPGPLH